MAHPLLDAVLTEAIDLAQHLLSKNGEFFPFGIRAIESGELIHVHGYTGEEQPPSNDIIDLLKSAFLKEAGAGEIVAAAICYDVTLRSSDTNEPSTDAVCTHLEHVEGECFVVYLPYTNEGDNVFTYGEVFAEEGERCFFK
ncbi:MAG: hypothetical protein AAF842_05845 [Planctomycetota bacterium]